MVMCVDYAPSVQGRRSLRADCDETSVGSTPSHVTKDPCSQTYLQKSLDTLTPTLHDELEIFRSLQAPWFSSPTVYLSLPMPGPVRLQLVKKNKYNRSLTHALNEGVNFGTRYWLEEARNMCRVHSLERIL